MPLIKVRKAKTANDPIFDAAARMEPKMQAAFLKAVKVMKDSVSLTKLTEAISTGNIHQALAILALDKTFTAALSGAGIEAGILSLRDALQASYAAGAKVAMSALPSEIALKTSFNLMNPEAVNFLEQYNFNLIQQIATDTRLGVQQALVNAFTEGKAPAVVAREIRESIGLTANQEKAIANYRNALEDGGASELKDALGRSLRDGRYDSSLMRAINDQTGLPQARIDQMVSRYRERMVNYRAKTIARTETIRGASAGQRELWKQAANQGLLDGAMREWMTADDDRVCDECDDLDEVQVGLDEDFPGDVDGPPLHPNCRCTIRLVFNRAKKAA